MFNPVFCYRKDRLVSYYYSLIFISNVVFWLTYTISSVERTPFLLFPMTLKVEIDRNRLNSVFTVPVLFFRSSQALSKCWEEKKNIPTVVSLSRREPQVSIDVPEDDYPPREFLFIRHNSLTNSSCSEDYFSKLRVGIIFLLPSPREFTAHESAGSTIPRLKLLSTTLMNNAT